MWKKEAEIKVQWEEDGSRGGCRSCNDISATVAWEVQNIRAVISG